MTVKELIEKLQEMPLDAEVYKENVQFDYWYADYGGPIHAVEKINDYEVKLK